MVICLPRRISPTADASGNEWCLRGQGNNPHVIVRSRYFQLLNSVGTSRMAASPNDSRQPVPYFDQRISSAISLMHPRSTALRGWQHCHLPCWRPPPQYCRSLRQHAMATADRLPHRAFAIRTRLPASSNQRRYGGWQRIAQQFAAPDSRAILRSSLLCPPEHLIRLNG